MTATQRKREAARILIVDDSVASMAAIRALQEKDLSFFKQPISDETEDCDPPCLIAGEGRFSGRELIEGYANTIDSQIKAQM
ncbi:hypothetical protein KKH96_02455 [Patescibacteria group bacterium]|nr:hypothetical protein [Patescibacteria group bacterium]